MKGPGRGKRRKQPGRFLACRLRAGQAPQSNLCPEVGLAGTQEVGLWSRVAAGEKARRLGWRRLA